jgi:hypothetical protein
MVYNTTQLPPTPPPPTATHYLYILYVYFGKGGRVREVREEVEGQQFTRGFENTNMTNCISSIKTLLNTNTETTFRFGVFWQDVSLTDCVDSWPPWRSDPD